MPSSRLIRLACVLSIVAVVVGAWLAVEAPAQGKKLKIGVVFDYTARSRAAAPSCTRSAPRS